MVLTGFIGFSGVWFAFLVIFYFHPFLGAFRWDYFLFFGGFLKQIQG